MFINNHSYFSLRYGTVAPESILKMAQKQGIKTLALTDINNTSASLDFVRMAPKYNIKPVLGVDFRNNGIQKFIILAQNNNGFQQINTYLSHFTSTQICDIPERAKTLKDTVVIYPYIKCRHFKLKKNEFLGVNSEHIPELEYSRTSFNIDKILILHTCSFRDKKDFNTHRLLRAIDQNTLLSKLSANVQGQATDLYINESYLNANLLHGPNSLKTPISYSLDASSPLISNTYIPKIKKHFRGMKKKILNYSKHSVNRDFTIDIPIPMKSFSIE